MKGKLMRYIMEQKQRMLPIQCAMVPELRALISDNFFCNGSVGMFCNVEVMDEENVRGTKNCQDARVLCRALRFCRGERIEVFHWMFPCQ